MRHETLPLPSRSRKISGPHKRSRLVDLTKIFAVRIRISWEKDLGCQDHNDARECIRRRGTSIERRGQGYVLFSLSFFLSLLDVFLFVCLSLFLREARLLMNGLVLLGWWAGADEGLGPDSGYRLAAGEEGRAGSTAYQHGIVRPLSLPSPLSPFASFLSLLTPSTTYSLSLFPITNRLFALTSPHHLLAFNARQNSRLADQA